MRTTIAAPAAQRVYSYMRFSTPEQAMGDSERRQYDGAKRWAEHRGFVLDDSLRMQDKGLSGFHGAHRKDGAPGKFLACVEAGDVPHGSILLVENIDRLSREGVATTLQTIIFKLWDHGITLATLSPEEMYEPRSGNDPKFLGLFLFMQRAHDESKRKSERIGAARERAREQAREQGRVLTAMCPAWLRPKPDRSGFEVIDEAAQAIRMIFDLAASGWSTRRIEKEMNTNGPWVPEKRRKTPLRTGIGWRTSYIKKILHNRAVIGEYQPHVVTGGRGGARTPVGQPIEGYYPAVVPPDLYFAVQQRLTGNKRTGGRTGRAGNVLTHLVKCAYCGGPMRYENKGQPPKGGEYLVCDNGVRGVMCARHRVRYDECVNTLLDNLKQLKPEHVLPRPDEQTKLCKSLRTRIAGAAAEMADIDRKLTNLSERVGDAPSKSIAERLFAQMTSLEERKADLAKRLQADELQLRQAEKGQKAFADWKRNLAAVKMALAGDDPQPRLQLRAHLREFIAKVEVYAVGYLERYGDDGKTREVEDWAETIDSLLREYDSDLIKHPRYREFLEYVTAQRMSKKGRFYRVAFSTGAVVDVVPPGSIASGMQWTNKPKVEWRFIVPAIQPLWEEFVSTAGGH